jgi:cytochrome bd ubiquinol oxidase subunit I
MSLTPLILSRLQFAFTISYHIIFPSFTIGLAAWLAVLEGLRLATGLPVYRRLFDFWLKIFAIAFGLGVVSGIVMAFEFGTNWSQLAGMERADVRRVVRHHDRRADEGHRQGRRDEGARLAMQ